MQRNDGWGPEHRLKSPAMDFHRLEALSTAALYNTPENSDSARVSSTTGQDFRSSTQPITPNRDVLGPPISPPSPVTAANNNLSFLLNPASHMSPAIDPRLQGPFTPTRQALHNTVASSPSVAQPSRPELAVETEHEIAFLLRYFSETPGQWWCIPVSLSLRERLTRVGWIFSTSARTLDHTYPLEHYRTLC